MLYKITIEPAGEMGTPFHSDTLFGHACWAIALYEGAEAVSAMIRETCSNAPPLIFSDGFPSGYLPIPLPLKDRLLRISSVTSLEERQRFKAFKKIRWIKRQDAEERKWNIFLKDAAICCKSDLPLDAIRLRNTIDRFTGTSLKKNGLFEASYEWYSGIWSRVDVYANCSWSEERLAMVIERIFSGGYGKDTTSGCGQVKIDSIQKDCFPAAENSSFFLSLSRLVPCEKIDMGKSFWQVDAKYGKTWQALGAPNPFKKPLMQMLPGSVFSSRSPDEYYGRVIADVHSDKNVVENCMSIAYHLPETVITGESNE